MKIKLCCHRIGWYLAWHRFLLWCPGSLQAHLVNSCGDIINHPMATSLSFRPTTDLTPKVSVLYLLLVLRTPEQFSDFHLSFSFAHSFHQGLACHTTESPGNKTEVEDYLPLLQMTLTECCLHEICSRAPAILRACFPPSSKWDWSSSRFRMYFKNTITIVAFFWVWVRTCPNTSIFLVGGSRRREKLPSSEMCCCKYVTDESQ